MEFNKISDQRQIDKIKEENNYIFRGKSLVSSFDKHDYYNAQPLALDISLY